VGQFFSVGGGFAGLQRGGYLDFEAVTVKFGSKERPIRHNSVILRTQRLARFHIVCLVPFELQDCYSMLVDRLCYFSTLGLSPNPLFRVRGILPSFHKRCNYTGCNWEHRAWTDAKLGLESADPARRNRALTAFQPHSKGWPVAGIHWTAGSGCNAGSGCKAGTRQVRNCTRPII
jgi:hypothetical protein